MKRHIKAKYRSGLEDNIYEYLVSNGIPFEYEPKDSRIHYIRPATNHTYLPDFVIQSKSGKRIIIETKGIWDYEDRVKHLLIRNQYPELDIRFVFTRSASRIRKGSKTTYRDICEGRGRGPFKGVTWKYADKHIPEEWLNE